MRSSLVRLAVVGAGIVAVISCDAGPVTPRFGNGIAGGVTGTAPVTPPSPGSPDTNRPFVRIDTPATTGQLVNVGDSMLIVTRIIDDRQLSGLTLLGLKFSGDASLGTLVQTIRYPAVVVPVSGGVPFRVGLTDTIIRRFLKPAVPLDSAVDSLVLLAIALDGAGNVDTARRRVNLVTGPAVTILAPATGDSVPQNVLMTFSARVTHNAGVRTITMRVRGETTWPASAALDTTVVDTIVGIIRDTTVVHRVLVPLTAPPRGRITVTASATDITSNPGSAPPVTVIVRQFGTSAPRVTQIIPPRLERTDSITVIASGDGIVRLGFIVRDSTNAILKDSSVAATDTTSNARATIGVNLAAVHQGKRVKISSYAVDLAGVTGFSISQASLAAQTSGALAFADSAVVVFGRSYRLPRPGVVGDIAVDTVRSRVLISNMDANRLEVWQNSAQIFDPSGIAVGSQPWGLAVSVHPDTLLVANSGGTNISRVFLGSVGGPVSSGAGRAEEVLSQRIRTRTNFLYIVTEAIDNNGSIKYGVSPPRMFSDRPQYIGQTADRRIYFSTKPTQTAPEGTVRYLDPAQAFPDLRTFVFVRSLSTAEKNYVFIDADSVFKRLGGPLPDTLYVFDHLPGTNTASVSVKAPTCGLGPATPGITACGPLGAADPRHDPRFPNGLAQGSLSAALAMHTYDATCTPNCSDLSVGADMEPVGITDTTFVSVSADRNWIAFGEGNSSPGFLIMGRASPFFFSPIITQVDLTNQAAERVFGLAIDSTGLTIAAHGSQSFYSAVDEPFHLRLQGIYGDAGTGGAGIAYHPRANGTQSPENERLSFVAAGDRTIHAVDIAFFIRRGRYELKHQPYGALRVSRAMQGDNPATLNCPLDPTLPRDDDCIVLKLFGVTLEGGLIVIDLRTRDILAMP